MNIMVVEDNAAMRALIKQILTEEIQDVETVYELEDGIYVLDGYEKFRPDWILMDIEMKKMDGLTASKVLLQKYPEAKIIIVTQYDDNNFREFAHDLGILGYVVKDRLYEIPGMMNE